MLRIKIPPVNTTVELGDEVDIQLPDDFLEARSWFKHLTEKTALLVAGRISLAALTIPCSSDDPQIHRTPHDGICYQSCVDWSYIKAEPKSGISYYRIPSSWIVTFCQCEMEILWKHGCQCQGQ